MNLKNGIRLFAIYQQQPAAFDKRRASRLPAISVGQANVHAGGQAIIGHVQPLHQIASPGTETSLAISADIAIYEPASSFDASRMSLRIHMSLPARHSLGV